ncbi:MAG TPA: IS481 family transposase [Thermoanaerobaculia bacterium]|nr:IS481 family transposase [Thermoanaerobaculia bacterium]
MDEKKAFVELASKPGVNRRELCRRFGIGPTTGYQLLARYLRDGDDGLAEHSRRPLHSPRKTEAAMEEKILELRDEAHWGGRKIANVLSRELDKDFKPSTVNSVLRRNGRITPIDSLKHVEWVRFEHEQPNDLWQMDFMGPITTARGRFEPLTIIDDHSRFNLCLRVCSNQQTETVQTVLTEVFTRYGLPWRMTMDNGSPWGDDGIVLLTKFTAWLVRLGIGVSHSRPYHPQTQGKDERLHRTIRDEVTNWIACRDDKHLQQELDVFSNRYNYRRPHEALGMQRPADRYRPSGRSMPKVLLPIEYGPGVQTRHVDAQGKISFKGYKLRVGMGCAGMLVGLHPVVEEKIEVYFCNQKIAVIDVEDRDDPRVVRTARRRVTSLQPVESRQTKSPPRSRIDSPQQRNNRQRTR